MTTLRRAVEDILKVQARTDKPLAVIVAGHNGSGKSTMWRQTLADVLQIPLINADRMMLSILPEADSTGHLVPWAAHLRDTDQGWMRVAQQGVQAFIGQAMGAGVPFAVETVFSHWQPRPDGTVASKIELIQQLQSANYFVLLLFVGLASAQLSISRVQTRVLSGGHAVEENTLRARFPRTQTAVAAALGVADAAILMDNSRGSAQAFTVCRVQLGPQALFDLRDDGSAVLRALLNWMDRVSPP